METVYVDTNVFLRYLLRDNINLYKQAETLFQKAKKVKIKLLVPSIVIFEIAFVLKSVYKETKDEIAQKIESLIANKYLILDDVALLRQAVTLYKNSSHSLVDCFLVAKSQTEGHKLFTFDKKLSRLA